MHYRSEIDGLRSIAVLPVIAFHAGLSGFAGGFVGVDVFFVISGYLITGILISDLALGRFSILRFYERRARRILPALFLVMAVSIPFAWFWMLPRQFDEFAESLIAVTFFLSNVLFWQQDDYFGAAAELKPLLHTWSLAVEEQYYLFFPLLLSGVWRFGRNLVFWTILTLALASLMLTEWAWRYQPSANFYLAPTRIWELLAGALCALILARSKLVPNDALAAAGLVMILGSVLLFDHQTPFPSLLALVPVSGAALIILFASPAGRTGRLLSSRPLVGIGLISYSAYLWHQPLFAFARLRFPNDTGPLVMAALSLAALALAYLTWRLVEQPVRLATVPWLRSRKSVFAASGIAGLVFVLLGSQLSNQSYVLSRLDDRQRQLLSYLDFAQTPAYFETYRNPDCFYGPRQKGFSVFNKELCLAIDPGRSNVLLLGDSHAAHLWLGLSRSYPGVNVLQATASGCLPMQPYKGAKRCTDLLVHVWEEFLPAHRLDAILLAGRWERDDLPRIAGTLRTLGRFADRVILIGPTAEFRPDFPMVLSQTTPEKAPVFARRFADESRFALAAEMRPLVLEAGGEFIDIAARICAPGHCLTQAATGEPLIWDYGHFTPQGAETIMQALRDTGTLRLPATP